MIETCSLNSDVHDNSHNKNSLRRNVLNKNKNAADIDSKGEDEASDTIAFGRSERADIAAIIYRRQH